MVDVAVVVAVGRADQRPAVPGQREDPAVLARGDDAGGACRSSSSSSETVTWVPRLGEIRGISASSWISSGRIRSAQTPVALITFVRTRPRSSRPSRLRQTTPTALPSVLDQVHDLDAVAAAPRRTAPPRRGSSAPAARRRSGSRRRCRPRGDRAARAPGSARSPRPRESCGGDRAPSCSGSGAASDPSPRSAVSRRRSRRPLPTRVVAITSYMFSPIPIRRFFWLVAQARHQKRRRIDEMRRQLDHELALEQRLADQPEVEVLEVSKTSMDHLRRAARGARRPVGALDDRHRVAARGGVERHAGAGDAAADHDDVELSSARRLQARRCGRASGEFSVEIGDGCAAGGRSGAGFALADLAEVDQADEALALGDADRLEPRALAQDARRSPVAGQPAGMGGQQHDVGGNRRSTCRSSSSWTASPVRAAGADDQRRRPVELGRGLRTGRLLQALQRLRSRRPESARGPSGCGSAPSGRARTARRAPRAAPARAGRPCAFAARESPRRRPRDNRSRERGDQAQARGGSRRRRPRPGRPARRRRCRSWPRPSRPLRLSVGSLLGLGRSWRSAAPECRRRSPASDPAPSDRHRRPLLFPSLLASRPFCEPPPPPRRSRRPPSAVVRPACRAHPHPRPRHRPAPAQPPRAGTARRVTPAAPETSPRPASALDEL